MWWIIIALVALFCYVFFLITKAAVKAAIRELEAEKRLQPNQRTNDL